MPEHDCDKEVTIARQGAAIEAITASMNQAVEQLKAVARLLEQNAETRTGIKHLEANLAEHRRHVEREQEAQWRRIDESIALANRALAAAAEAANAASKAAAAAEAASLAAEKAATKAEKAELKASEATATPGKMALKILGTIALVIFSAWIGAKIKGG